MAKRRNFRRTHEAKKNEGEHNSNKSEGRGSAQEPQEKLPYAIKCRCTTLNAKEMVMPGKEKI